MAQLGMPPRLWRSGQKIAIQQFGLPVPRGKLAQSPHEAKEIARELGKKCHIKSQILGGDRGKGTFDNGLEGGIQRADAPETAEETASRMLGHRLRTAQSIGSGSVVNEVLVSETVRFEEQWYLAMTLDRENYSPVILLSKKGGVGIETLVKEDPAHLHSFKFRMTEGITAELLADISGRLETTPQQTQNLGDVLNRLHRLFVTKDATLLEIDPLALASDDTFTCLDAKFSFDDAAAKRQPELFALRDTENEVPEEVEAEKYGLVYVRMDGNIGNVVNGAGLAMATNDAIAYHGGASANFLDAGGQATKETMMQAFQITLRDERVKAMLVNVYGGITRCDMIAESVIGAATELGPLRVPLVVRLQGTNSEKGLKMLEEADLGLYVESDFGQAAATAVRLAAT